MSSRPLLLLALLAILAACSPTSQPKQLINDGIYNRSNSDISFNEVRSVAIDPLDGYIWIGYSNGVGTFNGQQWKFIAPTGIVNDIAPTKGGMLFAVDQTAAGIGGLFEYHYLRTQSSLPLDNQTILLPNSETRLYHIEGTEGGTFVSTFEGVIKVDSSGKMSTAYSTQLPNNIYNNHIHATLHSKNKDIWVGHIERGLSWFNATRQEWWYVTSPGIGGDVKALQSDKVRALVELPDGRVFIGTDGGGITEYNPNNPEEYQWKTYRTVDGVPDTILDLAVDKYGRAWAASNQGVIFLTNKGWQQFTVPNLATPFSATSIAFGTDCRECYTNSNTVVIGTQNGIIVGKIPAQ